VGKTEGDTQHEEAGMSWLLRERATGKEWRFGDSDTAWDAGGYDPTRFEAHVLDERVDGAPDGYPADAAP
jgi:hypothetical protein